jgi:hypothetical protein
MMQGTLEVFDLALAPNQTFDPFNVRISWLEPVKQLSLEPGVQPSRELRVPRRKEILARMVRHLRDRVDLVPLHPVSLKFDDGGLDLRHPSDAVGHCRAPLWLLSLGPHLNLDCGIETLNTASSEVVFRAKSTFQCTHWI